MLGDFLILLIYVSEDKTCLKDSCWSVTIVFTVESK